MAVVATIRPACDGIFGPCVAVEESTTNLITNVSGVDVDFETDSDGDGVADGWQLSIHGSGDSSRVHSKSLVEGVDGGLAQRVEITAVGNSNISYLTHYSSGKVPVAASTTYTASVYVRGNGNSMRLYIYEYDSAGAYLTNQVSPLASQDGTWQRLEHTWTTDANAAQVVVCVDIGNGVGHWVEVDKIQLEQKPFATSFVDGTRDAPLLKYSIRDFLKNPVDWTLAFWVQPKGVVTTASNQRPVFWCLGHLTIPASADYHHVALNKNAYDGSETLQWRAADGLTQYDMAIATPAPFPKDAWHLVVCVWNKSADIRRLYVDGVEAANGSLANYRSEGVTGYGTTAGVAIGHVASNSTYPANALFSNVLTVPYAVDAATVKEWWDLRKPFFDPAPRLSVPMPSNVSLSVS